MRQAVSDFTRPLRWQTSQNALLDTRTDHARSYPQTGQAHDRRRPLAAAQRPSMQPIRAAKRQWQDLILDLMVVDGAVSRARHRGGRFEPQKKGATKGALFWRDHPSSKSPLS
jgi:hypothetical protein